MADGLPGQDTPRSCWMRCRGAVSVPGRRVRARESGAKKEPPLANCPNHELVQGQRRSHNHLRVKNSSTFFSMRSPSLERAIPKEPSFHRRPDSARNACSPERAAQAWRTIQAAVRRRRCPASMERPKPDPIFRCHRRGRRVPLMHWQEVPTNLLTSFVFTGLPLTLFPPMGRDGGRPGRPHCQRGRR